MNAFYKNSTRSSLFFLKSFIMLFLFTGSFMNSKAQCPANIDYEQGTFNNWQLFSGFFNGTIFGENPVPPINGRHEIISAATTPNRDPWGNFPKLCPNGSGYSVRMGLETTGTNTDRVTYTFTIPAGQNTFSLIYNYAIVINNGGGHPANIQPSLIVVVKNITDNVTDYCSSDTIAYSNAFPLPGFQDAPSNPNVKFKPWAARSIGLDGNAGKTIEISFTATGCGASGGTHFGYAYIDVNTECSSSFIGAAYCPDDTLVSVTGPFGYETYTWWDVTDPSTILATTQTITFQPPPPSGKTLNLAITPYFGIYGCPDTLTVQLMDTLNVFANAGPDRLSCQNAPVQLGINPTPGFVYSWSPVTGLSDPNISNPIATPSVTTAYILTVRNSGGGCLTTDTVLVNAAVLDNNLTVSGPTTGCSDGSPPTILEVAPADSIQWYLNGVAIPGATNTQYTVIQAGTYHATVFSFVGCNLSTAPILIDVNPVPIVGFNSNTGVQCFRYNQFNFTNTSTVASGTLSYDWNMGDGNIFTTRDVTHSYTTPGTYLVKLIVTTDQGCIDSSDFTVIVHPDPVTGFSVNTSGQCLTNNSFIFTNSSTLSAGTMQYNWYMGDGNVLTTRDVTHSYLATGTYTVRLTVTSEKGCADVFTLDVTVDAPPVAGFSVANPQQCFGNNQFNFINTTTLPSGTLQYDWDLGDGNTATTRDVTHSYAAPGDYIVKMIATSDKGCSDSFTLNVKVLGFSVADFYVEPACINLKLPITNKTINTSNTPLNYLWDFGNGQTSTQVNPVYSYPAPGNYTIKLSVNSNLCPQTITVKQQDVVIDAPSIPLRYADETAVMNFPEQLEARQIGTSVLWTPSIHLDDPRSFKPSFKGLYEQLYTIQIKSATGCITVDTQLVKIKRKIEIYVPTSFTPNGDGRNEYLRPVLMGFKTVNYFRVYNRWGKLLYQMQSDLPGWDGRINGQRQEIQTVVWMIEAVDVDGVTHKRQGTSVLLY